jgi:hypothetical protein
LRRQNCRSQGSKNLGARAILQAQDKDGTNLPREVAFKGTLPDGSSFSVASNTAGLYALPTAVGSTTVNTWWGTHLVNASLSYSATANATLNIITKIARQTTGSNYVLISINGTDLNTPSLVSPDGWKIDSVAGSGQKELKTDLANWFQTGEPQAVKVASASYDRGSPGWTYSSGVLTFDYVDFNTFATPTVEMTWQSSGGSGLPFAIVGIILLLIGAILVYFYLKKK